MPLYIGTVAWGLQACRGHDATCHYPDVHGGCRPAVGRDAAAYIRAVDPGIGGGFKGRLGFASYRGQGQDFLLLGEVALFGLFWRVPF